MILKELVIKNFRGYREETRIAIDRLTAFIGKNDSGKSTILDALAIFFDHPLGKMDSSDICVYGKAEGEVIIGCVFEKFPERITIDDTSVTSFSEEYLLNANGYLEIHKVFEYSAGKLSKAKHYAIAKHPSEEKVKELLLAKNATLKALAKEFDVLKNVDARSNVSLRKAIWNAEPNLNLQLTRIPLDKIDEKIIFEQIKRFFPQYALFRADRPSTDEDAEVQDPLKVAIKQSILDVSEELEQIKIKIQETALDVARRTLDKLSEFDSNLAAQLLPEFKSDPKWDSIFKLSISGDNQIPINKRGSGVRRLILFSFFRAEAERLQEETKKSNIIYAIEEPETAQHPENQKKVFEALEAITQNSDSQVLLTTHVPGLAAQLPITSIRYVSDTDSQKTVTAADDTLLPIIAKELGVIPDRRVKVLLCVEGPNDICFLKIMSSLLHKNKDISLDIFNDHRIAMVILGGATLQDWVTERYLKNLGLPEYHIYDRDNIDPATGKHHYQDAVDQVNARTDGSKASLTSRREMENYLHLEAINAYFYPFINETISIDINRDTDVTEMLKPFVKGHSYPRNLKALLNREVAAKMTVPMLHENGTFFEIKSWFDDIIEML